jgi:hypothetical protein
MQVEAMAALLCEAELARALLLPLELLQPLEALDVDAAGASAEASTASGSTTAGGGGHASAAASGAASAAASAAARGNRRKEEGSSAGTVCSLTFDLASEGSLFITWSDAGAVGSEGAPGALATFVASKPVPRFKLKQNGGKSELIRGLRGGTGKGQRRYYEGWVQFLKLAREFGGAVTVWQDKEAAVYYCDRALTVHRVVFGEPVAAELMDSVAVLAPGNAQYEGVVTTTRDFFVGCGNREGAALLF